MIFWICTCASRLVRARTSGAISSALDLASSPAMASIWASRNSASFLYLAIPTMASFSVTPDLITSLQRYLGNRLSVPTFWFRVRVRVRVTFVESQFGSSISLKALSGSSAALVAAGHTVISISTGMNVSISRNPSSRILFCTSVSAASSSMGLSICTSVSPFCSTSASLAAAHPPPNVEEEDVQVPSFTRVLERPVVGF